MRQKKQDSQSLLLKFLWKKFGGPKKVSQLLGVRWFAPGNWERQGGVSIENIAHVATTLKVPHEGLNYRHFQLLGKATTWSKTVSEYGFSREQIKVLIKMGAPK